jgi:hypothetical protein
MPCLWFNSKFKHSTLFGWSKSCHGSLCSLRKQLPAKFCLNNVSAARGTSTMIPRHPGHRGSRREYMELLPVEKLKLLNKHSMGVSWGSLDEKKWCLHCRKQFSGLSARIYRENGKLWVECGTPDCDGSPLDFANFPWWDPNHPLTQKNDEAMDKSLKDDLPKKSKKKRRGGN